MTEMNLDDQAQEVVAKAQNRARDLEAENPELLNAVAELYLSTIELWTLPETLVREVADVNTAAIIQPLTPADQKRVISTLRATWEDIGAYTSHHDRDDSKSRPLLYAVARSLRLDTPRIEAVLQKVFG